MASKKDSKKDSGAKSDEYVNPGPRTTPAPIPFPLEPVEVAERPSK